MGRGQSRFTVVSMPNTVYPCIIIYYCTIFHRNGKPTFAPPCICKTPICFLSFENFLKRYLDIANKQEKPSRPELVTMNIDVMVDSKHFPVIPKSLCLSITFTHIPRSPLKSEK